MANQEHLDILKQGVGMWNKWRVEHPEIEPDLSRTDSIMGLLIGINLTGANLSRTNLRDAILLRNDLSDVDLSHANLQNASLAGASLHEVDLSGADLSKAELGGTKFYADFYLLNILSTKVPFHIV